MPAHDGRSGGRTARPAAEPSGWLWTAGVGETSNQVSLGEVIKAYRATRGLTQSQLATLLDVDQSYVSKVENDQRGVRDVEMLRRIAERLSISPRELGLAVEEAGVPQAGIRESQREWRLVRQGLNR